MERGVIKYRIVRYLLIFSISLLVLIGTYSDGIGKAENTFVATYGGAGTEEGHSIEKTKDGGYILVGQTDSLGLGQDILVIKTDVGGQIMWQKTYGTYGHDSALYVGETSSHEFFVAGYNGNGTWVLKLNQAGDVLWQKEYLASGQFPFYSEAISVVPSDSGGLIVAGIVVSKPQYIWVFEVNKDGTIVWQRKYRYEDEFFFREPKIHKADDKGYLLVAETSAGPFENGNDLLVIKLNSIGEISWKKVLGDATPNIEPVAMQQSSDKGYIIASEYYDGFSLIKIGSQGTTDWQKKYTVDANVGGTINGLHSLLETSDGGFVAFGAVRPGPVNMWLLKFDGQGVLQWQRRLGRNRDESKAPPHDGWRQYGRSMQILEDGGFIVAGTTDLFGTGDNFDVILMRLNDQGEIEDCCIEESPIELEVAQTYFVTVDTDIISSELSFEVFETSAFVATPPFTPNAICCGEENLNIRQGGTDIPSGGSYDFGDVHLGESVTTTFLFENNSNEKIGVGPIQVSPARVFTADDNSFYILPNSSKSFEIKFTPTEKLEFQAEITFPNSDCDENPYSISLIGTGSKSSLPSVMLPVVLSQDTTSR